MVERGKRLETKVKNWLSDLEIYHKRFYDARSMGGYAPTQPSDFWVWMPPRLIFVECKESMETTIPYTNFRPSQLKSAISGRKNKIVHLCVVSIQKRLYGLEFGSILKALRLGEKSFNEDWAKLHGKSLLKRSDFENFLMNPKV